MTTPSLFEDQQTRERIVEDLDCNLLVEAAAGTGKTTCIVDRMVNLIEHGCCQIETLVAVTFTRKAAAELRERFSGQLRRRAAELQGGLTGEEKTTYMRVQSASDHVSHAFVGTIHSLCASLLRERPIEFGVDPTFRELDEEEDAQLRQQAWQENMNDMFAADDPLMDQIDQLGLDRKDLKICFDRFIEYRDVQQWPCSVPPDIDVEGIRRQVQDYIQHIEQLAPTFPRDRGNDELMDRYEEILRTSQRDWSRPASFFRLLERFDRSCKVVQYRWGEDRKSVAKQERDRHKGFREDVVQPALQWWYRKRYRFVVQFVQRAVEVYQRQKAASGGLDFTDLLVIATAGLKSQPELRRYFQRRFTHLLVDEFQDTDPIQAEVILYLTSENVDEQRWDQCRPRPGSLFLVGDPKQSIYRFRRGDIVTYNRVRDIFERSGGEVLSLVKNFRCRDSLRRWNNRVYQDKFEPTANQYITAAEDMLQGREDARDGALSGVYKLTLPTSTRIDEATAEEADAIARFIRNALDAEMTVPRTAREIENGCALQVQPRDFLIIPRRKKRIDVFTEALQRLQIPCEVTGGNALVSIQPLSVMIDCLRTVDDPHHPVHYLAILRDRLFGFSDEELFQYRQAGGRFSFTATIPDGLDAELKDRFADVQSRLSRYQVWLRAYPYATALDRIAGDLGLLAEAAASSEGNIALGGFLKAIDVLRAHNNDFDNATDLISYLERLGEREEMEGCTALSPDTNVVRVMNLHKAKGLEAPVVFLADTSWRYSLPPICHIDRSGAEPEGFMGITARKGDWGRKDVATPENWKQRQGNEQRFLDAEADRLLYVATTRAACMMVVSVGNEKSTWSSLHSYLDDVPELESLSSRVRDGTTSPSTSTRAPKAATAKITEPVANRWNAAAEASYAIESAKEVALKRQSRPDWHATGDYGYKWGSAVHALLEAAINTSGASLQPTALSLVRQYDLGSDRVEELVTTVGQVMKSEIWKRATEAGRCFSELPFETYRENDGGQPVITRGVIDLVFEEPSGWVIVDYKTDDISETDVESAVAYYSAQLKQYAESWHATTGMNITEQGLYFTRTDTYVVC